MRRNRVSPFGQIEATAARGTLLGNRGMLHDATGELGTRLFRSRAWVTCRLAFRGRRIPLASPGHYTVLFFHDEAVALAAGHRPCAECRNADYKAFKAAWRQAHGGEAMAATMDSAMHPARIHQRKQVTWQTRLSNLPDAAFVTLPARPDDACVLWQGMLHPWTRDGRYGTGFAAPGASIVTVLTPAPVVAVLGAGYRPALAGLSG